MLRRPTPHNAQCYWEDTNTTDIVTLLHKHVCTQKQICSIYSLHNAMKTNVAQCTMYSVTGTNINTNNNIANRIQREMGTKECLLHYVLGTKTRTVAKTTLFFNCCLKILKKCMRMHVLLFAKDLAFLGRLIVNFLFLYFIARNIAKYMSTLIEGSGLPTSQGKSPMVNSG